MSVDSDLDVMFAEAVEAEAAAEVVDDLSGDAADEPVVESAGDVEIDDDAETDNPDPDVVSEDGAGEEASFNWEDYADQLIPLEHNGEVEYVSLKDLRDGNMRQADYTRKTQELSEVRKRADWADAIQTSFERDPMGTLQALANAYGVTADAPPQQEAARGNESFSLEDLDEDVRPWAEAVQRAEQRAQEMEARLVSIENDRIQMEIKAELTDMKARYGESFDPVAVLNTAADRNMSLEDAYWALQGRRSYEQQQQQTRAEAEAARAAEEAAARKEAERKQAKSKAAAATTGSFKASDIEPDDFNDIGELMEQLIASGGS